MVVNGDKSSWQLVASGILQGAVLGPVLFNIFMNLDEGILGNFGGTKLNRSVDLYEGRVSLERDLVRLHQWAKDSGMRLNKAKGWILHLRHNNPTQCSRPGEECLQSCPVEKEHRVLVHKELKMCAQ